MSKAIEIKQGLVSEIAEKLDKATSCVVVDYRGLTVEEVTELRNKFREAGVDYKVYKNTMVRRAASQINKMEEFNDEKLVGTNAFAISYDDAVIPAKVVSDFAKTHPNLEFKMGYIEGEFYDAAGLEELSKIPSREELIAKLLGSLKAPMSNFVYLLDAIAKQKEEQTA
ncbi:50S ribosomal protein L10 [Andreesenia angusta]|uniref:Large ribosomal subunit protein uL10 n=1 Tax=Andreesenia angusta TaxID=39480 RepID=A0A1S1V7N8_9FIRM|nr:50S ribosomal protein L10 [Andreesenia angusta]OHW62410.1 50S ribosomal protein L10 [Andreesenia angusta]